MGSNCGCGSISSSLKNNLPVFIKFGRAWSIDFWYIEKDIDWRYMSKFHANIFDVIYWGVAIL